MNIVYILSEDISIESGVTKKIMSQIKYWKSFGHSVQVVSLKSETMEPVIPDAIILSKYIKEKNIKRKLLRRITIAQKLNSYLKLIDVDIIYTRYIVGAPDIVHVLKKFAPYIIELNTNDIEELKGSKKSDYILNQLTRTYFLSNASGFISVSRELIEDNIYNKFKKENCIIGNGYDFSSIHKEKTVFNSNKTKFVFIGSPYQKWHGIDKILILARILTHDEFHIVGPNKEELEKFGSISKNIIVHGYCNHKYINDLIVKCDIGLSTLALHRKKMNEASPLKSREYLAHGLPIIIGYKDTDLYDELEFVLNIGNYENNIIDNIKQIKKFIKLVQTLKPQNIIKESRVFLDYKFKEEKRLSFIEDIYRKEKK